MLKTYSHTSTGLEPLPSSAESDTLCDALWIIAASPTKEEVETVEKALGMDLEPNRSLSDLPIEQPFQIAEKQISINILAVCAIKEQRPSLVNITFLRAKSSLVTLTDDCSLFDHLLEKYQDEFKTASKPDELLVTVLGTIIDDTADMLDKVSERLDRINDHVFQHHLPADRRARLESSPRRRSAQLEKLLHALGFSREMLVKVRRSILSLRRLIGALKERSKEHKIKGLEALVEQANRLDRELQAISDAEIDLSSTTAFMLDGAVGFIGIQQNKIVTVLTAASIVFTPPILIAGIYGMNFKYMPELSWSYGYVYSLALLVLTGLLTFGLARWRGWL